MTTLAADQLRQYEIGELNEIPVIASDIIYRGAAVGDDGNGRARPLQAGDPFLGFADAKADNSGAAQYTGGGTGSAGNINVVLRRRGLIHLAVTGVTGIADIGKPVYASDDNTFTLTAGSNTYIGRIIRHVSSTTVVVAFDASRGSLGEQSQIVTLTDSTGLSGSHDDTLAATTVPSDITGGESPTEAEHNAALAVMRIMAQNDSDLAQKVIELVARVDAISTMIS